MRGKVDDFVYVLAVAAVILIVMALVSPLLQPSLAPAPGEINVIKEFTLGSVGYISEIPAKTLTLGSFTVGETQVENLKSISLLDVSASLLGGEKRTFIINVPGWYFDSMEKVTVSFNVDSTNMYGPLIVSWNGKIFYQDKAYPRAYRLEIDPQYVEEQNTLEIACGGPGMMFWANTVYVLKDLKVNLEYGPAKLYSFELYPSEIQSFKKGVLEFYGAGRGELSVKVNGVTVYKKIPKGADSVEFTFDTVPLNAGNNIVTLSTAGGSVQLFNAEMKIYLLANQITRERTFNITASDLASLKSGAVKGRIDYTIDKISREGPLKISLNGNALSVPTPVEGTNTVYFSYSDAQEGRNTLEFSSTGSFEISDVSIGWERA